MSPLDRDELAARNLVSLLSKDNGAARQLADFAVECADALIARLAPAPVVDAPVARHEWVPKVGDRVRVTRDYANHANVKAGDEYVVTSLGTADYPETEAWGCGEGGMQYVRVCNLEPCDAPAPVPSLADGEWRDAPRAPAPYVPAVGDVVMFASAADAEYLISRVDPSVVGYWRLPRGDWHEWSGGLASEVARHVIAHRPATAAERVAAGLPPEAGVVASVPSVPTHKDAAPASVPTPAIDPRRTVGAVVRPGRPTWSNRYLFAVVSTDEKRCQRWLPYHKDRDDERADFDANDVFVRWMTPAECEQHGVPYVARTAPASKPVDREGLIAAMKKANEEYPFDGRSIVEVCADAAIKFLGGAS